MTHAAKILAKATGESQSKFAYDGDVIHLSELESVRVDDR